MRVHTFTQLPHHNKASNGHAKEFCLKDRINKLIKDDLPKYKPRNDKY